MNQSRTREVAAVDHILEDMVVLSSCRVHRHRMLHRVPRAVLAVMTPGRNLPPYLIQVPLETIILSLDDIAVYIYSKDFIETIAK